MIPIKVVKDIFLVELKIPLQVLTVNCYVIVNGNYFVLVDAGILSADCFEQLERAIKLLGQDFKNLRGVVITHAHVDHFGLAGQLHELTGAKIYLHVKEKKLLKAQLQGLITEKEGAKWLKENGTSEKEISQIQQDYNDLSQYITSVLPITWLKDKEYLPFCRKKIEVVWTPGHTQGHVCLYVHERSVLLSGDHILGEETSHIGDFWWTEGISLQDYFNSLDIVKNINPNLILPAHGKPFNDVAKRCNAIKDYRLKRNRRLIKSLAAGRKNAWELVADLWGDALDIGHKRLALADVLAHLKYLQYKGWVKCQRNKNIFYWQIQEVENEYSVSSTGSDISILN